jgi:hypothetical protein
VGLAVGLVMTSKRVRRVGVHRRPRPPPESERRPAQARPVFSRTMAETAPAEHDSGAGFLVRNNAVTGSVLSLVALLASIALGAVLMLATGTRGIAAIGTVLLIAGGTFSLLFLLLAAAIRAAVPDRVWENHEDTWRDAMGIDPPTPESEAASRRNRRLVALGAVVAIVLGLCMSVVPATLS